MADEIQDDSKQVVITTESFSLWAQQVNNGLGQINTELGEFRRVQMELHTSVITVLSKDAARDTMCQERLGRITTLEKRFGNGLVRCKEHRFVRRNLWLQIVCGGVLTGMATATGLALGGVI